MPNVAKTISANNKNVSNPRSETLDCKCVKPPGVQPCPLNGRCEEMHVVYKCTVTHTASGVSDTYAGLTAKTFKDRYTKHKASFNESEDQKNILSSHIWQLKDRNLDFQVKWEILDKAKSYHPLTKSC